mmetsp:Transcript_8372/g.37035  ORF Transcript_8372/g.37035 Transcript_8372/m.37035 type:complete len:208 (-) Transcript_8372:1636-2259(-)
MISQLPSALVTAATSAARPGRIWFSATLVLAHGSPAACIKIAARVSAGASASFSAASVHLRVARDSAAHSAARVAHAGTTPAAPPVAASGGRATTTSDLSPSGESKVFDCIKRIARRLAARQAASAAAHVIAARVVSSSSPTPLASDVDTATVASTSCGGTDLRDDDKESSFASSRTARQALEQLHRNPSFPGSPFTPAVPSSNPSS